MSCTLLGKPCSDQKPKATGATANSNATISWTCQKHQLRAELGNQENTRGHKQKDKGKTCQESIATQIHLSELACGVFQAMDQQGEAWTLQLEEQLRLHQLHITLAMQLQLSQPDHGGRIADIPTAAPGLITAPGPVVVY